MASPLAALVTARSAPAHERAIRTLMDWNIEVDEAMFLGGLAKGEFLREFPTKAGTSSGAPSAAPPSSATSQQTATSSPNPSLDL